MTRRLALVLAIGLALGAAACGNSNKVGSKSLTEFKDKGGQGALGNTTTTKAVATTAGPATTVTTTKKVVTTVAAKPNVIIKIQGDGQGNAYEPSRAPAPVGSLVRWTNMDSKPHRVLGRKHEPGFDSGPIAPGASWDFKVNLSIGTHEYTDEGYRTYAIGYLVVQ